VNEAGEIHARALEFVRRGLSVIPVPRPRAGAQPGQLGDGKIPAIPWRPYQQHIASERELKAWFSTVPQNIAIVTGAVSGIVVVDADTPEAVRWSTRKLRYTPWQAKTSRGFHLYYAHPGVPVANRARIETPEGKLAIDCRGDGGYVIAPTSIHASGAVYEFAGDWTVPREQLPRFWPGWLQKPTRTSAPRPNLPRPTGNVSERARKYLGAIPLPVIGQGSDAAVLYAACRLTRGFGLSASEAESLLWEWCGNRPGWSAEWIARKVAHAERYGTEPIGAFR
jgi:hypothetical protein